MGATDFRGLLSGSETGIFDAIGEGAGRIVAPVKMVGSVTAGVVSEDSL